MWRWCCAACCVPREELAAPLDPRAPPVEPCDVLDACEPAWDVPRAWDSAR
jgi:hypothetical protein